MMGKWLIVILLSGLAAGAQNPPSGLPSIPVDQHAQKIVDDAVAALGGRNFLNMEDSVESGRAYSFYRDKLSGLSIAKIYTRYVTVNPLKSSEELAVRERQAFGKNEDAAVVFRQEGAANINWRGAKEMPAEDFARYRDTTLHNILYILRVRLHEPGLTFEFQGADVVDRLPVNIVDVSDAQNRKLRVYFHQTTKLPVKQSFSRLDPVTKDRYEEVTRFDRYRDNNGINWPQQITRERNGEKIYQIFAESVAFNQGLTDDLFSLTELTRRK
jgi:hypothetical protein